MQIVDEASFLTDAEYQDVLSILSPVQRAAVREMVCIFSCDLAAAEQEPAAWLEAAAWLLTLQVARAIESGGSYGEDPKAMAAKLEQYVIRRCRAIINDHQADEPTPQQSA